MMQRVSEAIFLVVSAIEDLEHKDRLFVLSTVKEMLQDESKVLRTRTKPSELDAEILAAIQGGLTSAQSVANKLGRERSVVQRRVNALISGGHLVAQGNGHRRVLLLSEVES